MKTTYCFILIAFGLVLACNTKASKEGAETPKQTAETPSLFTKNTIENLNYADYALSAEAEEAVAEWEKYQELAIQINYLKQGDVSFFNGERELLNTFTVDLDSSIPETLKTNPIASRVAVVITAMLKLNDDLTLDNIDKADKLQSVKLLLVSFSNLNFQINKKLERDLFDSIQPE